jgi:diadenosine tetraphosphatase ApaH/serine/threonine PP2A family protein phosphatase
VTADERITICHGAPFDEDFYLFDEFDARLAFDHFAQPIGFYGHTHVSTVFRRTRTALDLLNRTTRECTVQIEPDAAYLINPGSVGQPRDNDPRAAYALYDTGTARLDLIRVPYQIALTQQKMTEAGLPAPLIRRLESGR